MRNSNSFDICSLWLPLVLLGSGLLVKPAVRYFNAQSVVKQSQVSERSLVLQAAPAAPKKTNARVGHNDPAAPMNSRQVASIHYLVNDEVLVDRKEVQDIETAAHREREFLKKQAALTDEQIAALEGRRVWYLEKLRTILKIPKKDHAEEQRKALHQKQLKWMTQQMGLQNYLDYLNLTSRDLD